MIRPFTLQRYQQIKSLRRYLEPKRIAVLLGLSTANVYQIMWRGSKLSKFVKLKK